MTLADDATRFCNDAWRRLSDATREDSAELPWNWRELALGRGAEWPVGSVLLAPSERRLTLDLDREVVAAEAELMEAVTRQFRVFGFSVVLPDLARRALRGGLQARAFAWEEGELPRTPLEEDASYHEAVAALVSEHDAVGLEVLWTTPGEPLPGRDATRRAFQTRFATISVVDGVRITAALVGQLVDSGVGPDPMEIAPDPTRTWICVCIRETGHVEQAFLPDPDTARALVRRLGPARLGRRPSLIPRHAARRRRRRRASGR